jgi:hypothetical protein
VSYQRIYNPLPPGLSGGVESTVPVMAGLAEVSTYGLGNVSIQLLPMIAATYSIAFITDPRYVINVAPLNCTGHKDCLSIFMPGGMEAVRAYGSNDATHGNTIFSGDSSFNGDYDAIVIRNAPGYQIEYDSITNKDPSFTWNRTSDCTMHMQTQDDGLYMCIRQVGLSMYIGWTACTTAIYLKGQCQSDTSWTDVVEWNSTVNMYRRNATVAYDRYNISILGIQSITPPEIIKLEASNIAIFSSIVMSPVNQTPNRTASAELFGLSAAAYTFGYGGGYIFRLYQDEFQAYNDGGRSILRSYVAVPLQFATSLRQKGNISQESTDNLVEATLAKSSYRAIIEPWTVSTFGVFAFSMTIWCLVFLVWISFFAPYYPNLSFFPEINITSKSSVHPGVDYGSDELRSDMESANQTLEDLAMLTRSHGLGNGGSRRVVDAIKRKRVYCGSLPGTREGEEHIVLVTREGGRLKVLHKNWKYA